MSRPGDVARAYSSGSSVRRLPRHGHGSAGLKPRERLSRWLDGMRIAGVFALSAAWSVGLLVWVIANPEAAPSAREARIEQGPHPSMVESTPISPLVRPTDLKPDKVDLGR